MEFRQNQLLNLVIESYIETALPVGSRFLVEQTDFNKGEATARNELRALEEEGYLTHPHTSAGRTPTTKGYKHYLDSLELDTVKVSKKNEETLKDSFTRVAEYETARKNVAKTLVDISNDMVLIAFSTEKVYYTGLSNLFSKPDFTDVQTAVNISAVFDRCEESLPDFFEVVETTPKFFLGKEHPFGDMLSVLSMRFGKGGQSMLALIGPQRMDYKRNWSLIKKAQEVL
jgi:heat-inducible transcriptional repressor